MKVTDVILQLLLLCGGIGLLLYSLSSLSLIAQRHTQGFIKTLLEKASNNKYKGVLLGTVASAACQSSTAVTVLLVSLTNSGIISFFGAAAIIMGANIGTTFTVFLLALPVKEVLCALLLPLLLYKSLSKKDKVSAAVDAAIYVSMVFLAMKVLSLATTPLSQLFEVFFSGSARPILLFLSGMLVTAIIQSGSATTAILLTLAAIGSEIAMPQIIYAIFGINIGTCLTSLIAGLGLNNAARGTAVLHLLFNVLGVLIFYPIFRIDGFMDFYVGLFDFLDLGTQIAVFHLLFNIASTAIMLPFTKQLTLMAARLCKIKSNLL